MNGPYFRGNFFLRALLHCLLLKVSGSMSDFWESVHEDLSREESPPFPEHSFECRSFFLMQAIISICFTLYKEQLTSISK